MNDGESTNDGSRHLTCPICAAPMETLKRQGVEIERCTNCRGVFLDRGELEKIVSWEAAHDGQPTFEQLADEDDEPEAKEKLATRRSFFSGLFDVE